MTFFTWSGRARALPTSDSLLSVIFIISVPVEIRENWVRTSTPPGRQAGTGTSSRTRAPDLEFRAICFMSLGPLLAIPALEGQELPDLLGAVGGTAAVVVDHAADHLLVDQASGNKGSAGHQILDHVGQVAPDPGPQRRAEEPFGAVDDLLRQPRLGRLLEDRLALPADDLGAARDGEGGRGYLPVHVRHAHLGGGGHAGPVRVGQVEP